jgi:N-acyl amino acid synthase FeeM
MRSPVHLPSAAIGRGSDLLGQVDYRLAETSEEKEEIYKLRYRAYLREGAIAASPVERNTDQYDGLPNSWTFGVYFHGELHSSVRISVLTSDWRLSCSTEIFGEILHPRLDRGETIIDPSRFVADPDKARRFPELPYLTLRLAYMACDYFNADLGLAIVRAEHQAFYRRVFLHETIAEPRMLPGLLKPVGLMAADFPRLREKVFERYPMMRSTAFERRMLFDRPGFAQVPAGLMVASHEVTSIVPQTT